MVLVGSEHLFDVVAETGIVYKTVTNRVLAKELSDLALFQLKVKGSQAGSELYSKLLDT